MKATPASIWLTAIAVAAAILSTGSVMGAEKKDAEGKEAKLTKKDLPASVMAAFTKSYPKAVIKEVSRETEDSTTIFEIESVDGTVKRTLSYTPDGSVSEIEEVTALENLPAAVRGAISKDYAKGKLERIEKVTKGDSTTFEILVTLDKVRSEVVYDSVGKVLETEKKSDAKKDND
jgi:hypothetical protein